MVNGPFMPFCTERTPRPFKAYKVEHENDGNDYSRSPMNCPTGKLTILQSLGQVVESLMEVIRHLA